MAFFIGLACGAILGFMGGVIIAAGRIADLERAEALQRRREEMRQSGVRYDRL